MEFIMYASINLYSVKVGEIQRFLNNFFNTNIELKEQLHWCKEFKNPIEIVDFIGTFIDNSDNYDIAMWISLDKDVLINVNNTNANNIIKYFFERYPY